LSVIVAVLSVVSGEKFVKQGRDALFNVVADGTDVVE